MNPCLSRIRTGDRIIFSVHGSTYGGAVIAPEYGSAYIWVEKQKCYYNLCFNKLSVKILKILKKHK